MEKISAEMTIAQIIKASSSARKIFMRHGMYCIGCAIGESESLADAAEMHQVDLEEILAELNNPQEK